MAFTLSAECELQMFESIVLGKMFETKKHKASEQFNVLHNEKQIRGQNVARAVNLGRLQ
jgi:hypothetical protein